MRERTGDDLWRNLRPPLDELDEERARVLAGGSEPYLHERVWFPRADLARHPDWAIRHELEDGRIVRTVYDGPVAGEERYHYAGDVLVAIDEFHHLPETVVANGWRAQVHNVGGRVEVGDGILTLSDRVIWRASDEPLADRLARVGAASGGGVPADAARRHRSPAARGRGGAAGVGGQRDLRSPRTSPTPTRAASKGRPGSCAATTTRAPCCGRSRWPSPTR